ncbi:PH domain-containing protein [Rhodococcus rhodochrous]|uniref:PH domain-containing protein n=1 Tax=Rhodococcus rhodochrous TaxID=1829 RepID=UPI0024BB4FB1|nr:PH domain-containing protein [Rhodococcus rhodochrous]MDJ0401324.1 PH domain-containing protein [Rhodococcus rhodochrous]
MGIVRTSTTRILAPIDATHQAVAKAMGSAGLDVTPGNPITGTAKRSLMKNRWASTVTAGVRPETDTTTLIDWTVDMMGDKHSTVLSEILEALQGVTVDDLGVTAALERLGKMGRFFGFREASALTQYVHTDERVVELAQGIYDNNQGMLVLTTQRLFFFDKSILGAKVEEFDITAIGSLGHSKRMGGEVISISISGRSADIKQVAHGRAETFIQAFRKVKADLAAPSAPVPAVTHASAVPDIADQIKKLAELRDLGVVTEAEFEAKKADLLARM